MKRTHLWYVFMVLAFAMTIPLSAEEEKEAKLQLGPPEGLEWGMSIEQWKECFGEPILERALEESIEVDSLCCETELLGVPPKNSVRLVLHRLTSTSPNP